MIYQLATAVAVLLLVYRFIPFGGFTLHEREILAEADYCVKHREKKLDVYERCTPEQCQVRIDNAWPAGERWCSSCHEDRDRKSKAESLRAEEKVARLHAAAARIASTKFKKNV